MRYDNNIIFEKFQHQKTNIITGAAAALKCTAGTNITNQYHIYKMKIQNTNTNTKYHHRSRRSSGVHGRNQHRRQACQRVQLLLRIHGRHEVKCLCFCKHCHRFIIIITKPSKSPTAIMQLLSSLSSFLYHPIIIAVSRLHHNLHFITIFIIILFRKEVKSKVMMIPPSK